ncbi:MAG: hypothetical protein PHX09_01375, partial [Clostridia bacterium]|nr:hypothetical protein [Clostridia bacterium]
KDLEEQIEKIERDMLIERSKSNIKTTEENIEKFYTEALKKEPLHLINYLIKEIKLYNDQVEITLNTPTMKSPTDKGFSFLYTTKKLKKIVQNTQPIYRDITVIFYV